MELLKQKYSRDNYLSFLSENFNFSEFLTPVSTENTDVQDFKKLGFIKTDDNAKLPVFEIHIKPNTKLERNRVQLRNLVANQVDTDDGALAVYVDDKNSIWRFSFIAIEYEFSETGIEKRQTASKRFTYLLGEGAKTTVAKDRFESLNKKSSLENFKTAFAVGQLNKDFYKGLYQWYEKAQTQVEFPNDEKAENHIQTNLIRLLTRILFVWFLKEKDLINKDLFDENKLKSLIKYEKNSSFYKAILQNLFFATLNKQILDRSFRTTTNGKANSTNYLATNIYRYQDYFENKDKEEIMALFKQTPFLNGGLFECLDREAMDDEKENYKKDKSIRSVESAIRIDGFSDNLKNELNFSNKLFFNDDENNLGLIDLFKQYQFTIEESTPADIEVALDPELLGKVFENLLASYNPETKDQVCKQDRKATGSFYTPREIVSYMVDESLKQHFKTHTDLSESEINTLFIEESTKKKITKAQIKKVIIAIDSLKILDPAVGSGAYPMGILQRLVFVLEKIDPDNEIFKQQELAKLPDLSSIEQDLKTTEKINDQKAKEKATEELENRKQQIEDKFQKQDHNYLRKLHLIENCIYGVDIQPIAIQISKLRFFISLTIEQKPNENADDNYGIKALPNLETKFIVANTLLPLGMIELPQAGLFDGNIQALQENLATVRHNYFNAKTLKTKRKYKDEDKKIREDMLQELTQNGISPEIENSMKKVVHWDLYNQNSISDWFDPQWMFGVKKGFDIVIGNPPYLNVEKLSKKIKKDLFFQYRTCEGRTDIYIAFIDFSLKTLHTHGVLSFIIPYSFINQNYGAKLRNLIVNEYFIREIVDTSNYFIFENAVVKNVIISIGNNKAKNKTRIRIVTSARDFKKEIFQQNFVNQDKFLSLKNNRFDTNLSETNITLKNKIHMDSLPLMDICFIAYGARLNHKSKKIGKRNYIYKEHKLNFKPFVEGKNLERYSFEQYGWLKYIPDEHYNPMFPKLFESDKLMFINVVKDRLRFVFDNQGFYNSHTIINCIRYDLIQESNYSSVKKALKYINLEVVKNYHYYYLISLLNSNVMNWYFLKFLSEGLHFYPNDAKNMPIKKLTLKQQQPFINLVDEIIQAKKENKNTTDLEAKIDEMVYQLYDLTDAEIKIIKDSQ